MTRMTIPLVNFLFKKSKDTLDIRTCESNHLNKSILSKSTYLLMLSCIPDVRALLNHSHLNQIDLNIDNVNDWKGTSWNYLDATITRWALNVWTCGWLEPYSCVLVLFFVGTAETIISNSMSENWPEWRSRSAFFDRVLWAEIGGSHNVRIKLS